MQSDFRFPEVPRGSRPDPNRYRMPRRRASDERRKREKRLPSALRQAAHLAQLRRVQFREDTTPSATPVEPNLRHELRQPTTAARTSISRSRAVSLTNPQTLKVLYSSCVRCSHWSAFSGSVHRARNFRFGLVRLFRPWPSNLRLFVLVHSKVSVRTRNRQYVDDQFECVRKHSRGARGRHAESV